MKYKLSPLPNETICGEGCILQEMYKWYEDNEEILSKIFEECYLEWLDEYINHFCEIDKFKT